MSYNNVNVNVSGPVQPTSTYKTKVLKGNHSFASQVTEANMKYVIKYDFDLNGQNVEIPEGCILEFDGGSISNGTLTGNNTILIYNQELDIIFKNVTREGTFIYNNTISADEEDLTEVGNLLKFKDRPNTNGMGNIILRRNKSFAEQITKENTIYEIRYDFDLNNKSVTIPKNCVLEFDGGSLSNGTIVLSSNNSIINGLLNYVHLEAITNANNIQIINTRYEGNSSSEQSTLNFILFKNVSNVTLRNVYINNWQGCWITDTTNQYFNYDFELSSIIFIKDSNSITFDNVGLNKVMPEGVMFYRTDNVVVNDCSFDLSKKPDNCNFTGWTPIHAFLCHNVTIKDSDFFLTPEVNSSITNLTVDNLIIDNCNFVGGRGVDIGDEQYPPYGVYTFNRGTNIIRNCNIKTRYGIVQTYENSSSIENVVIENCTIHNTSKHDSFDFNDIRDSLVIRNCAVYGITRFLYTDCVTIKNVVIDGNLMMFADEASISTQAAVMTIASKSSHLCKHITISNNNINFGSYGASAYNTLITKNDFVDVESVDIIDNTIVFNSEYTRLSDISTNKFKNIIVRGNNIQNKVNDGYLITIGSSASSTVFDNNIFTNINIKLHALSDSPQLVFCNNLFKTIFVLEGNESVEKSLEILITGNSVDNISIIRNVGIGTVYFNAAKDVRIALGNKFVYYNNSFVVKNGKYSESEFRLLLANHSLFSTNTLPTYSTMDGAFNKLDAYTLLFDDRISGKNKIALKLSKHDENDNIVIGSNGFTSAITVGNTNERPTGVAAGGVLRSWDIGYEYFDRQLGKYIYVKSIDNNGVVTWVDGRGFTAIPTKGYVRPTGIGGGGDLNPSFDIGFEFFDLNSNSRKHIYANEINADGTITWVDALGNPVDTNYPKVIGTPTNGNLAKFNSTNIEDAGVAPQV